MSTTSDLKDVLRRRSVSSQAELTVEVTTASMVIRAVRRNPDTKPASGPLDAVANVLSRIDQLARYREEGHLGDLVDIDMVARASLELVVVMARAALDDEATSTPHETRFPILDSLIGLREAVAVDTDHNTLVVRDPDMADELAAALDELGADVLSGAVDEDRTRTSSYALF